VTKLRVTGVCEIMTSVPIKCFLCGNVVVGHHRCKRLG